MSNESLEEIEEPSGVLASPPLFNLWLMCSVASEGDSDKLLKEMRDSGDPVTLVRTKLAGTLAEVYRTE